MALQASGQISLGNIATEFSDTVPHNMSEFYGQGGAPSSGQLAASDFYGASAASAGGGDTQDIVSQFVPISEYVNLDGASDTSSNYSVSDVVISNNYSGRLYLIHKSTHSTSYYNDVPIACIQVLDPTGTTVRENWWFGNTSNGQGWYSHTSQYNFGAIGTGINIDPQTASGYSYSTPVQSGSAVNRFTLATSTGSSSTGAVDGIFEPNLPMTVGEKTMAQSSATTYYMYRETSGSTSGYCALCRSPTRTWSSGEIIRIAYIIGNQTSGYTPDDTLFVGIYT